MYIGVIGYNIQSLMQSYLHLYFDVVYSSPFNETNFSFQIAGKQSGYHAMAEFYQSVVCKSKKQVGEEIARLEVYK